MVSSLNSLLSAQPKYQFTFKQDAVPAADKTVDQAKVSTVKPSDPVVATRPVISDKPFNLIPDAFLNIFSQLDTDGNQLVTRDEITVGLKAAGATDKEIEAFIGNVLSATTDINGDGLSLAELDRRLKVDNGDYFAAADLNNDGQITSDELDESIDLYVSNGFGIDESQVRSFIAGADADKNNVLTRAEYTAFNGNNRPVAKVEPVEPQPIDPNAIFQRLFTQFDADNDGLVTRDELIKGLQEQGAPEEQIAQILSNVLSPTTDLNGDGLSRAELARRLAVDAGDTFAAFDLNSDNEITQEELDTAIKLYSQQNEKFDEDRVRRLFDEFDLNGNSVLARAEYDAYGNGARKTPDATDPSVKVVTAKPTSTAPVEPTQDATPTPVDPVSVEAEFIAAVKAQIAPSIATLDSQLVLLLQQDNA